MKCAPGLDYEAVATFDEFQVWTPDTGGACIGSGKTVEDAKKNAVRNMNALIKVLEALEAAPF